MRPRTPTIRGAALGVIILLVSGIGCSARECDPPHHPFTLDRSFSEGDLQDVLNVSGVARADVECEALCEIQYALSTAEHVDSIESCTLMIEPTPGDAPDDVAGSVQCSGDAVEYHCA